LPPNPVVEKLHSPGPAPEQSAEVDFAHAHGDALVIVKGTEGAGSGFICSAGNSAMLFTNTHVIADLTDPAVTRMDGAIVSPGAAEVAVGRDIARLALSQPPAHPLEVISDFGNNVRIGDEVVVLGNSGGGGVVTKIEGKIAGIGPDRIEVSAEFIPGNSGSPIIHVKTGQVIGIATYLTKRYEEFSSDKGGAAPASSGAKKSSLGAVVVRRFGYRIDNVTAWEPVEWNDFRSEAALMRQISALTGDLFDFLGSLRAKQEPNFATDTLRRPAVEWLAALKTKHVSDFDRQSTTRGFLNSLRLMVRSDVAAAEPRLRYTYFREELKEERRIRDRLYKSFDEQSAKLSEPASHPTSVGKSH
jgi:predicted subunit of tRNA(5-methylaminomethyl-2-thiouridylate) methyltransferase